MSSEMRVQSVYFSATGTTRKILSTIEEHTGLRSVSPIDLTLPKQREPFTGKVDGDLILVGTPVYHGTMPLPMMEPLNRLEGKGKWAVPVAVYGNRSAETCVEELAKILRNRGFKILAAAAFIGEHSMASLLPWGLGRPDKSDLEIAAKFGRQIKEKLISSPSEIQTSNRFYNFLTREMVDSFPEGYHVQTANWVKRNLGGLAFSKDAECTECMSCSNVCPTDAIKVDLKEINDDLCIRCMACARACPAGVLSFQLVDSPASRMIKERAVSERLGKVVAVRKEPKIYL